MTARRTPFNDDRVLTALDAAQQAGSIQRKRMGGQRRHESGFPEELVTQTDIQAEQKILTRLKKEYPNYSVLAEESGVEDKSASHRWIVDPLDGTVNFYHGIPEFAVSIALEVEGTTEVGVIYSVTRDTVFTAVRGEGAYREMSHLHVSEESSLKQSLIATGFGPDCFESVNALSTIIHKVHGVRRIGSAAIDLAYVASGFFEGFYQCGIKPWDIAAGRLLVEESGGCVRNHTDKKTKTTPDTTDILATNGHIHKELYNNVKEHIS